MVKVEVNHVFRGTVMNTENLVLSDYAQDLFAIEVSAPSLSPAELYGSKLVAAMDRQHPRDIFDIYRLYQKGGLSDAVVECFVCYLAGHNRPIHEVLYANQQDMGGAFKNEFQGMANEPIGIDELRLVRDRLWRELPATLTVNHRNFLSGLAEASPDWSLMACGHLNELPAIQWKLKNLVRLKEQNQEKFEAQGRLLRERFDM